MGSLMEYTRKIDTQPQKGISSLYRRRLPFSVRLMKWVKDVLN